MAFTQHPVMFLFGLAFLVVAFIMWRFASRWDLKGHAVDSAVRSLWHRRVVISDELQEQYRDVRDAPSHMHRASRVAGHAARHFVAQALSIGALVSFVLGAGLAIVAVVWK